MTDNTDEQPLEPATATATETVVSANGYLAETDFDEEIEFPY